MIKTFWGWSDQQLPDGTVIWTSPSRHAYVTTPGSAVLFPTLCAPTGTLEAPIGVPLRDDRSVMMPRRRHTRAQNRAHYVAEQRRYNQSRWNATEMPIVALDEPPPF